MFKRILYFIPNIVAKFAMLPLMLLMLMYEESDRSYWEWDCKLSRMLDCPEKSWEDFYRENHRSLWDRIKWFYLFRPYGT